MQVLCCLLFGRLSLMGERKKPSGVTTGVYGVTSFLFRALPGGGDPLQVHTSGLQGHQGKKQHYLLLI